MSKTITYFTSSSVPTSAELAEIATINAIAASPYEVTVLCGKPKNKLTSICLSAAATDNSYNDAGGSIEAGTISASSTDNSLNDSGSGFVTAGFQVGDVLTIAGFTGATANNTAGEAVVVSVTAAKMVLSGVTLTTDAAGETVTVTSSGRFLTWGFKVGQDVMVRGFTTEANNISTGIITALTASKMTIGGTDGDGIADEVAGDTVTICSVESDATYGNATITSDYVAGTIPPQYLDADGTLIGSLVSFDPANPPDVAALIETQGVISHGETVAVKNSAGTATDNATATVAAHAVTVALPATKSVVENGDTTTVDGATVTLAVGSGVISGGTLASTDCVVSTGDTVAVGSDDVTITVSGNAMTGGSIGATKTIVENADTVAVGSGTATLTVTDGALASAALDATHIVVADTQELSITSGSGSTKVTLTIAGGAITAVVLS